MLRAAPSVMDSAALFCLVAKLFLAWSPDHEYIVAHGIAQPCGGYNKRIAIKDFKPFNRVNANAAFFRQLALDVTAIFPQLP